MLSALDLMQLVQQFPMMRVELRKVVEDITDEAVQPVTSDDWRIHVSQGLDVHLRAENELPLYSVLEKDKPCRCFPNP